MNNYITKANPAAEKFEYVVYDLNGVTYLPHYRNKNIFIGPGYPHQNMTRYSDKELQMMGAQPRVEMLWRRGDSDRVTDSNP